MFTPAAFLVVLWPDGGGRRDALPDPARERAGLAVPVGRRKRIELIEPELM